MEKIWLKQYPAGVPAQIDIALYASLVTLMEESFVKYRALPAYVFMGKTVTFGQVDDSSRALA
ncbi:MAG TPA: long-chain fatty acid--CoA ligase, partial [Burkholderiaceae bacterium]|nr:long-chain fatty acid--CoA ligase [Burkholderiaceae bacterium]